MPCRFCGSAIDPGVSLCPTCKHHQSRLRNLLVGLLLYLGGITAFAALVGSAALYGLEKWNAYEATSHGTIGLTVIDAKSEGNVTFLNTGNRDIFVSCILFESSHQKYSRPINLTVPGGRLETVDHVPPLFKDRTWRCIVGDVAKEIIERRSFVKDQAYHWYSLGHPELANHFNIDRHAVIDGRAKVIYRPAGYYRQVELVFDCKVFIVQRSDKDGEFSSELLSTEQTDPEPVFYAPTPAEPSDGEAAPSAVKPPPDIEPLPSVPPELRK